jgi:CPA2 family monovalent cation:H+ antiporter-2
MIALCPWLLAVEAPPPFLVQGAALLVAAALIAYVCSRLGLVPIVGFLIAGVVIGPYGLNLVHEQATTNAVADVGVILLLFTIGIEFSLERLARITRLIIGGGSLQVTLASVTTMGLLMLFGVNWRVGLFTGFLVALSSTAIVLKLLGDRGETNSEYGQVALGLLIFQDLAVIVMVLLVPTLAGTLGGGVQDLAIALGKAAGLVIVVLVVARRLMPPLLEIVARTCSPELFLLTVVAICFGTAYLTSLAGVSISLGAFLAGLIVSESPFRSHAFTEILPLQILFSATFFVSVGMLLDLSFFVHNLPLVLAAVVLVSIVKLLTTGASVAALGYRVPIAAAAGLSLAQVGEFSFVLEQTGRHVGLTPAGLGVTGSQTFIATTVVSMIVTPFLTQLGSRLAQRLEQRHTAHEAAEMTPQPLSAEFPPLDNHVIVAGYGEAARQLVRVLNGSRIPYVITTLSPGGATEAESEGLPVIRGDASKQLTLTHAGAERARMIVIADDDPATAHRIAAVARTLAPGARILVRTRYVTDAGPLTEAGVDRVIAEEMESIVQLFSDVLHSYAIAPEEIERHEETVRRGGYAALRLETLPAEPVVVCTMPGSTVPCPPAATIAPVAASVPATVATAAARAASATAVATAAAPASRVREETTPMTRRIDTEHRIELKTHVSTARCGHVAQTHPVLPSANGCEECLKMGDSWVHLRICMTCGHVGCCDSSKNKHATKHFHQTTHPIVKSLEPGEDWGWCYTDEVML